MKLFFTVGVLGTIAFTTVVVYAAVIQLNSKAVVKTTVVRMGAMR